MVKLFLIMGVGYLIRQIKLINKKGIDIISQVLLWLVLPALIVSKTTSVFDPVRFRMWWALPIAAFIMFFMTMGIASLLVRPFKDFTSRKEFVFSCSFQNVGYIPIALTSFVCQGSFCDTILIYIFLFLIGFNLLFWSFGPIYLSNKKGKINLKRAINPPFLVTVFSIASVFMLGKGWIPEVIDKPITFVGNAAFPLALIMVGAYLAEYRAYKSNQWAPLRMLILTRLVIVPAIVFAIMMLSPIDTSYKFFLLVESIMPSAVSLIIIGNYTKADNSFFSAAIFYSNLFSAITIPLWLMLFGRLGI